MDNTLDLPIEEFGKLMGRGNEMVLSLLDNIQDQKGYHHHPQAEVEGWFDESLPQYEMDPYQVLEQVQKNVIDKATGNAGPHMYAYVMAGGTQMSIIAEQLATAINQNQGKWHLAPSLNEIEKRVVAWAAEMIGYQKDAAGILVGGGSAANLSGLTVARNLFMANEGIRKKGLFGQTPLVVYASKEVHGCVDKSIEVLGIGTNHLRKIDTNADFTINVEALKSQIEKDKAAGLRPFCLIGNAGTVNTGAIDDLKALGELAKQEDLWFHVDGAYGVLCASLDSVKDKYRGLDMADSVALDFHKWLYQPFEAGCLMVKNWSILKQAYFKKADYLDTSFEQDSGRIEFNEHSFPLSRNGKSLKIWMSIKTYGIRRIKEMIQKDIDLAKYLADRVEASSDFELSARSDLAIACFRYVGNLKSEEEIVSINERLIPALEEDGRVFITGTRLNGQWVIRACLINHRKNEATTDYLLDVIRDVAQKLEA